MDEPRALDPLLTVRAARRIGLRLASGEAPALLLVALGAPPVPAATLVGAGLLPALLAPVTLWAESRTGGTRVERQATIAAHVLATVSLLVAPAQIAYCAGALTGGPVAGLDAVTSHLARLPRKDPFLLFMLGVLATLAGAAFGGLAGARAAGPDAPAKATEARGDRAHRLANASLSRALSWSLAFAGVAWTALFVLGIGALVFSRSDGSRLVDVVVGIVGGGLLLSIAATLVALFCSWFTLAVQLVDELADGIDRRLAGQGLVDSRRDAASRVEFAP